MGKTGRWFRSLLSSKKSPPEPAKAAQRKKSKWGLVKSDAKLKNVEHPLVSPYVDGLDANKHAIAVAAATAAVAEAALAAAQAAAEVVRMTSGGGSLRSAGVYVVGDRRRVVAAVKIQSAFRAYLARRALRALKGLVKLQALVRGHIVRKQSADMLRRMQAMARIQARASAYRSYDTSNTKIKFSNSIHPGGFNIRRYDQPSNIAKHGASTIRQYNSRSQISNNINKETSHVASNWLDHWMEKRAWYDSNNTPVLSGNDNDERTDKILEIDTWKPHQNTRHNDRRNPPSQYVQNDIALENSKFAPLSTLSSKLHKPHASISSEEVSSVISPRDQVAVWPAENSPRVHSASSRPGSNLRGTLSPARSECSRSLYGDFLGYPNYMAYTESSRAKFRSQSAPKQRMQLEDLNLSWKFGHSLWDLDVASEKGTTRPVNYRSNGGYLNSGNMRKQGPRGNGASGGYGSTYGQRL